MTFSFMSTVCQKVMSVMRKLPPLLLFSHVDTQLSHMLLKRLSFPPIYNAMQFLVITNIDTCLYIWVYFWVLLLIHLAQYPTII